MFAVPWSSTRATHPHLRPVRQRDAHRAAPRAVYDRIAAIYGPDRDIAEQVVAFVAEAAAFGSPADLAQDLGATTRELAALRAQLEAAAGFLAEAELRPVGAPHPL